MEFNNKSKSLGISIPAAWADKLDLTAKQYVKLELLERGFMVEKIDLG
jgi:antitoxin component of MazEF toxin-antitoxin module